MEILSPAGSPEHIKAAVRSGADAVYLGTQHFNARQNAANFDMQELENALKYCHARGVKVYIALNTLIKDCELKLAEKEIVAIARLGADAVIIQDLAMVQLVKDIVPQMPLHASTQMSVHKYRWQCIPADDLREVLLPTDKGTCSTHRTFSWIHLRQLYRSCVPPISAATSSQFL